MGSNQRGELEKNTVKIPHLFHSHFETVSLNLTFMLTMELF